MSELFIILQENLRLVLSFVIITNFIIIFFLKFSLNIKLKYEAFFSNNNKDKDILLLIAHPDDETMFFIPVLKFLLNLKKKVRILCLSNGNFDKIGDVREKEFSELCKNLNIENSSILNDERLQDNLHKKWDPNVVANKIDEYLNKNDNFQKIGTIITFDHVGVTNHPNHISTSDGLM